MPQAHNTNHNMSYRLFIDPGHGWLEVPASEVDAKAMGISSYSWQHGDKFYLEEDVDLGRFVRARFGDIDVGGFLHNVPVMYKAPPGR